MSSQIVSRIFVLGATGGQGLPVVRAHFGDGQYSVHALSRDANPARARSPVDIGDRKQAMASTRNSLHLMVEQWLAPDPARGVRVIEFRNRRSPRECYVCVETFRTSGPVALFFFRHQDGAWRIFPPNRERPAMRVT